MRSLLRYLVRNYAFVLFLLLEGAALTMVFSHNSYQKSKYLNSSNRISGKIYETYNSVIQYFRLAEVNKDLAAENARLLNIIENMSGIEVATDSVISNRIAADSAYRFIPARIINNSVNKPFNYITLNKGRKDGIKSDQGIISDKGIAGVVTHVSSSYSVGLSLLNSRWSVSAMLKNSGYFGSLTWRGGNYRTAELTEIPLHVDVAPGDTVVTSGYSSVFPEGIMIGIIEGFTRPDGENYYAIKVELATDFKSLSYVEVIVNLNRPEIEELENRISNDPMVD